MTQSPLSAVALLDSLNLGEAEIAAYSSEHKVLVVTTVGDEIKLVDASDLSDLSVVDSLGISQYGSSAQGVDVSGGLVAVAVANKTNPNSGRGEVVFFQLSGEGSTAAMAAIGSVPVGSLPDAVSFNHDGSKLIVANEAQSITAATDAEGSISIIDTSSFDPISSSNSASTFTHNELTFGSYNGQDVKLNLQGVRISGRNYAQTGLGDGDAADAVDFTGTLDAGQPSTPATVAQDLEPECIAVLGDRAWVTLQENNAV
ncbi:MAG: hypothetical protein VKJ31_03290, partial [Synechococcus sp.]|nr:hypothetical protein [Synechococcus sp.]